MVSIAAKHLKKSVLELGGNDPAVVLDTDDVTAVAQKLVTLRLANAGQVCTSPKRIIVTEDLYDDFVAAAREAVENSVVGPADDSSTDVGPLSSEERGTRSSSVSSRPRRTAPPSTSVVTSWIATAGSCPRRC